MTYHKFTETFKNVLNCSVCVCVCVKQCYLAHPVQIRYRFHTNQGKTQGLPVLNLNPWLKNRDTEHLEVNMLRATAKTGNGNQLTWWPGLPASFNYIQRMWKVQEPLKSSNNQRNWKTNCILPDIFSLLLTSPFSHHLAPSLDREWLALWYLRSCLCKPLTKCCVMLYDWKQTQHSW